MNPNEEPTTTRRTSHVTAAPQHLPGENFDPQVRTQHANEPKVVHAVRQHDMSGEVSEENETRHAKSAAKYPHLNLSKGEFVVLDVKRHPVGLFIPAVLTGLIVLIGVVSLIAYPADPASLGVPLPTYEDVFLVILSMILLFGAGGSIAIWVYLQNQFYLTNESVIQEIQQSLFSRHEQTVSLGSIEDASFKQSGILQMMLNYGTVRLSTEGEETTYRFAFVKDPRNHVAILNNAIEAFKNGRPVDPHES